METTTPKKVTPSVPGKGRKKLRIPENHKRYRLKKKR